MLSAGVIEVLAGSEKFDSLGAATMGGFEDSGVQPLLQKKMGRQNGQHAWAVLLGPIVSPQNKESGGVQRAVIGNIKGQPRNKEQAHFRHL